MKVSSYNDEMKEEKNIYLLAMEPLSHNNFMKRMKSMAQRVTTMKSMMMRSTSRNWPSVLVERMLGSVSLRLLFMMVIDASALMFVLDTVVGCVVSLQFMEYENSLSLLLTWCLYSSLR